MISPLIKFQIIRLLAYVIITISYTKHNVNFWLLMVLFLLIESNVWISYFANRRSKKSDKEVKELLENFRDNISKRKKNGGNRN